MSKELVQSDKKRSEGREVGDDEGSTDRMSKEQVQSDKKRSRAQGRWRVTVVG